MKFQRKYVILLDKKWCLKSSLDFKQRMVNYEQSENMFVTLNKSNVTEKMVTVTAKRGDFDDKKSNIDKHQQKYQKL